MSGGGQAGFKPAQHGPGAYGNQAEAMGTTTTAGKPMGGYAREDDNSLYQPYLPATGGTPLQPPGSQQGATPGVTPSVVTDPTTQAPGTQAPGTQGDLPTPGGVPQGGMFWQPREWRSVPYWQTYGGEKAPFADLSAQILNTMRMGDAGAGRFGANAAARYGYQGGMQQFRPDANPYGQQISPYQWQPQNPMQRPPTGGAQPAQAAQQAPQPAQSAVNPGNFGNTFDKLMQENPALAYYATSTTSAGDWFQKNQNNIRNKYFGGDEGQYNSWLQQSAPQSSNVDRTGFADKLYAMGLR